MQKSKAAIMLKDKGSINVGKWLSYIQQEAGYDEVSLIHQATVLAQLTGEEVASYNGVSCFNLGLIMAEILLDLRPDQETMAAAIVYNCVHYAGLSIQDIEEQLNPDVAKLVRGTLQLDVLHSLHEELGHRQTHVRDPTTVDNLRRMFLAMVEDMRVVFLKMAERLGILRNVSLLTPEQLHKVATETQLIYAPLANRLGIWHLKWQLEDLSFRYLESEQYQNISKSLKTSRIQREQYVNNVIHSLREGCQSIGIARCDVTGRAKHIFSIYKKMQRKKVDISEIYDAAAFRILVPSVEDCYAVLSYVHSHWDHVAKEFDDYISQPKKNGYQSIHTAVNGPDNVHVEIQIRTHQMHEEAELGVAAHWVYKEGYSADAAYEHKITLLRQVMDWQKEVAKAEGSSEQEVEEIFQDQIYVFTPGGDIMSLQTGSTPLDFAYHVHSEVGNRCRGAKVNGVLVQLTHPLKTGDRVEILTAKNAQPSRDWLNPHLGYIVSSRAKAKIHHWFRKRDYDKNLEEGRDIFEKEIRRMGIKKVDQKHLVKHFNYKAWDDLLAGIGRGDLRVTTLVHSLQHMQEEKDGEKDSASAQTSIITQRPRPGFEGSDIQIHGVDNLLTHISRCCKPIPGDEVVGYITVGRGVSIHRQDCANITRVNKNNPERLIEVNWGDKTRQKYTVDLLILADDQQNLVKEVTSLLVQERIPIHGLTYLPSKKESTAQINLSIEVDNLNPLSRILARIQQIPSIIDVKRQR